MRALHQRFATAVLTVSVALVALSACGEEERSTRPAHTKDGLTVPGARLHVGQTATVERTDGTAVFDLTITQIERGDPADLRAIGYKNADHDTPYYVRYTMRVVAGNAAGVGMKDYLSAWANGAEVAKLVTFKPFPTCREQDFGRNSTVSTTITSCKTYLVDPGAPPVDTVRFINNNQYGNGDGTDIQWKQ